MSLAGKAIEIVSFPASEAYQKDVHQVDGALKALRLKTPHPFWVGLGTKQAYLYGFIPWNKIEDHQASIASPEFEDIKAGLGPTFADPSNPQINVVHATFTSDPTPALDTPSSEIWYVTPKEGVSLAETEAYLDRVVKALEGEEESGIGARASVAEKSGQAMLLIGWKLAEARGALGVKHAELRSELRSKVDIEAIPLKLTKSDI
ncbi:hypothetical protein PENSPDRAFT_690016 [Peniophora sp. CONT]|nr:hypothetical protein PENSPDRAFT_690016 [Peniophora sp. CONT]